MQNLVQTKLIVNISDAKISDNPEHILITYSLGSCIAVSIYDPGKKIGGMIHYQLPSSGMDSEKAGKSPFMYADTGIRMLLEKMLILGADKRRLQVNIAGGSAMNTGPQGFDIGKRNYLAARKFMWKKGIMINSEQVGGAAPRNMLLNISDGQVSIKCNGMTRTL